MVKWDQFNVLRTLSSLSHSVDSSDVIVDDIDLRAPLCSMRRRGENKLDY